MNRRGKLSNKFDGLKKVDQVICSVFRHYYLPILHFGLFSP
jgi:hypothetical protein